MQNERLRQIIREMQRHRFGRRAETLPEDQMLLGLEEVDQTVAGDEAAADQMVPAERAARAEKRRSNRGSLPEHLPRIEIGRAMVPAQNQSRIANGRRGRGANPSEAPGARSRLSCRFIASGGRPAVPSFVVIRSSQRDGRLAGLCQEGISA
jgi:hypothetical protein